MGVLVSDELRGVYFNDARLSKRILRLGDLVAESPNKSLPAATLGGRAELEGAYRLLNNKKVSPEAILASHFDRTLERILSSDCELIIFAQDTSKVDLTRRGETQVQGAGKLSGKSKSGMFIHPLVAFTDDNLPLGVIGQQNFIRPEIDDRPKQEKAKDRKSTAIEFKESFRWIQGVRRAKEVAEQCPKQTCVIVQDSEADMNAILYEDRQLASGEELHLIFRSGQARSTSQGSLYESFRDSKPLLTGKLNVSARKAKIGCTKHKREQTREARVAEVEVKAKSVTFTPSGSKACQYNVVLVDEVNPPAGVEPIRWLLVTSLPIGSLQQVQQIIQAYCTRWQIEIFFRTLKSGCRIERRQFLTIEPIESAIALYMIVAWRIMHLCMLGRNCPELSCEVMFQPCEWKSVFTILKMELPSTPPTINQLMRAIARLGGFIDRPKNVPGPETTWKGMQDARAYANAWIAFGPDTRD